MTTNRPTLGPGVDIDVARLIESRLLIQANSGGGKSWAIRRLLEQTYGACQHIVIDVEGEFHTLREKFDYVLAGQRGSDCPATTTSAALLARRLLELNVPAIIDIYELGAQRQRFVRLFLESLVNAPRELWHPALVIVDEAQLFCPEVGSSESTAAVADLMGRGRKRGFCGVLATQRIAKLNKDAAAETNNKLIGRTGLDIDMRRAGDELGFASKEDRLALRKLPAGTFYAFGPAFSLEVVKVSVGPVATTHPKAGQRAAPPTPPRGKVREVLAQLADLPAEAEAEARTAAELRAKVVELEKRLAARPTPAVETKVVERRILTDADLGRLEKVVASAEAAIDRLDGTSELLGAALTDVKAAIHLAQQLPPKPGNSEVQLARTRAPAPRSERAGTAGDRRSHADTLPIGEAATLRALIQYTAGLRREQLTVLTGYKRSTRDAYIARLRDKGLIEATGDVVRATREGVRALPGAEPLPTGPELQAWWRDRLPSGERVVLEQLIRNYPDAIRREMIDADTGFRRSTRDAYLSRLAAKQLVEDAGRGEVRASATLFEVTP